MLGSETVLNGGIVITSLRTILLVAALVVGGAVMGSTIAAQNTTPIPQDQLARGEDNAKQMLLLMDKDKDGKVSKQEFMSFMEAEFERLDTNKDGKLDVEELTRSQFTVRPGPSRPR